jgi:hypothetical protein|tara:strand:- start:546 stop:1223 length:678 start_codon:yes stop_codon:yes gene_type:complete
MPITDNIPIDINTGAIISGITWLVLLIVVAFATAILTFVIVWNLRFNRKILIFENIAGQGFVLTGKDRAMLTKVGDDGMQVLYLRKRKVYKSAEGKKMGKNTYWFAINSDGYWRNFTLSNLDDELKKMNVNLTTTEMRAFHTGIRRGLKERYDKASFWQKYGGLVAYVGLIAITGIMTWLLFDKYIDISNSISGAMKTAQEVMETSKQILGTLDNVGTSGGLIPQ